MIKNLLIGVLAIALVSVVWMNALTRVEVMPSGQTKETDKGIAVHETVPAVSKSVSGVAVDMSNKGLTSVSQEVFTQSNTTSLNLSGNALTGSLPAEVRLLSKLTTLNLSNNNFTGVPAEVGQLTELRVLNLSHNPITGLPLEIGNLTKLEKLDLTGTNYSKADLKTIREKLPATTVIVTD